MMRTVDNRGSAPIEGTLSRPLTLALSPLGRGKVVRKAFNCFLLPSGEKVRMRGRQRRASTARRCRVLGYGERR